MALPPTAADVLPQTVADLCGSALAMPDKHAWMLPIMKTPFSVSVERFWVPQLANVVRPSGITALRGWSIESAPHPSFVEAELSLRQEHQNLETPIWLVAAPGAVGKSTLAKQISARTGALYLDLAKADTVAGNSLTGGLFKTGLLSAWSAQQLTVLIDALDEARLRVTQSSFDDFLDDVSTLATKRTMPIVIFGRVGIIDEAWLVLADKGINCPIFDIGFFDVESAQRFVMATLDHMATKQEHKALAGALSAHRSGYETASREFVNQIRTASQNDGNRFAGYAPVLQAVARVLASETNPSKLEKAALILKQKHVLQNLTELILAREEAKLREQLVDVIPESECNQLYTPDEQLSRLAAAILRTAIPPAPQSLSPQHAGHYDTAVRNFMPQHPFLDGTGQNASGAVFEGAIIAHALTSLSKEVLATAQAYAGHGPHTPNPFLFDFYIKHRKSQGGESDIIPPEHVAILYDSIRAGAAAGDIVRLTVEGDESSDEADVEILFGADPVSGVPRRIQFKTSQAGTIRFGRAISGVLIDAPLLDVEVGQGGPVELVAPVLLNVAGLKVNCAELVVVKSDISARNEDAVVSLEAQKIVSNSLSRIPIIRKGAELSVSWPGANTYPWASFASDSTQADDTGLGDALRALRRLVLAFRSHSKGRLARYRDKIEHARMTKGTIGIALRQKMVSDGILSLEESMYFLEPDILGSKVGATYQDLKLKRYGASIRGYVRDVLTNLT